jgi:ABC-type Fe3+-hydroxamate transport system substrate-binding protein
MSAPTARLGRRALLASALATPLISRSAHAALPPFNDAIGRSITLKAPAERIVLGFNYEEFTAIAGPAGWDRVVGFARTLWTEWRPSIFRRYLVPIPRLAGLPDVGNTEDNSFSLEKVLSLRPDLVVMAEWSFSSLGPQVAQLEALGIPVMVIDYNAEIPERHVASTLALGIATGNIERAQTLARLYSDKLADIRRRAASVSVNPKIYVELGQGGAGAVGNTYWKGMWGRLIDFAGAENIAAGRIPGAWGPLNPEYVLAANPDAIFIAGSSWANKPSAVVTGYDADLAATRASLAPYAKRQGWANLKAIRDGQLFAIEHGLCRALYDYTATYYIAKQVFPDAFADIDPVDELRRYHAQFLPVAFEGTWMTRLGGGAS